MEWIEAEGETKEEAREKALAILGVNDLELIEILEEKVVRKFLGVGGRIVRIKARLKGAEVDEPAEKAEDITKPQSADPVEEEVVTIAETATPIKDQNAPRPKIAPIPSDVVTFESRYRPWASKGPGGVVIPKRGRGFGRRLFDPSPFEEEKETAETTEVVEDEVAAPKYEPPIYADDPESPVTEETCKQAVSFVEQVIKDMSLEGTAKGYRLADRLFIQIESDAGGLLIGRRGETIDALQFLADIVVNRKLEHRIRVVLDTENYRDRRKIRLIEIAGEAAIEADKTGREVPLAPMNPAERRVIHTTLAEDSRVETFSDGAGSRRRVIVKPAHKKGRGQGGGRDDRGRGGGGGGRGGNNRGGGYKGKDRGRR